jgi:transketolase
MRNTFARTVSDALDDDPRVAVVLAAISAGQFAAAAGRHPDRVIDVGIREQAMIGVTGGLALAGMRPVAHSYTPFLIERPFEQVKLDLGHQDVGAILVSIGGSYDASQEGRTHMSPGDVALLDSLHGWTVHVPGHPDEVRSALELAIPRDDRVYVRLSATRNASAHPVDRGLVTVRTGSRQSAGVVIAVGPLLDRVLDATAGLDVAVAYAPTVRPFDKAGLNRLVDATGRPDILIAEPYLRGTSAHEISDALSDRPHRLLSLGVARDHELRAYGSPDEHASAHGLDADGIAKATRAFFGL